MANKKIEPHKKRKPRYLVKANDEEWMKMKRNAASFKSMNELIVSKTTK